MPNRHNLSTILLAAALTLSLSGQAHAAVTVGGAIDAGYPTWNRITDRSGFPLSANTGMPYEVLEIRSSTAETLTATINSSSQFDSFLALYTSQFSPLSPQTNLLAADDDGNDYPHAKLTGSSLAANTSYFLVISSYSGAATSVYPRYGSYSLTLSGNFSVVPQVTTTTVNASPNPAMAGQSVTITATVSKVTGIATPTGAVTFAEGVTPLGSGALDANGQATFTTSSLATGTHVITASYGGETKYGASSNSFTLTISQAAPTVSAISPSSGTNTGGTTVVISGTDLSGTTAVNFGATPATSFTINSASQISSVSPSGVAGQIVDVTVTTPGGTSAISGADQFTFVQDQAKNQTTGTVYALLANAFTAASGGAEIRAYGATYDGPFTLDKSLSLRGGWDGSFLTQSGSATTLNGDLTVTAGDSGAQAIVIKGRLTNQGGSLTADNVTVTQ